ncbi:MAG: hypothetical protein MJK14_08465 [Rivularia sp. ALOHA_DT_140]|nr:hypothetical protein [Rivularia sp. ALOHA_DT_140]
MRTVTDSAYKQIPTPANQAYSASVPLSVYRELAAELQATQAAIHQLNQQNEHLAQENHVLRQEIAKTVNAVMHLQNAVNYSTNATYNSKAYASVNQASVENNQNYHTPHKRQYKHQSSPSKRVKRTRTSPVPPQVTEYIEPITEPVFIEEEQVNYYYDDELKSSQVSGWWLIFAIVFIIFMGFGAGYVVVRPLLENHTR